MLDVKILWFSLIVLFNFSLCRILIRDIKYVFNDKLINVTEYLDLKNENPLISANLTLLEEFQKLTLKVKLTTSPKDNVKHTSTIFDTTFDACKLSTGFTASLILKAVYEKLNRYSNITFSCPFRKGLYQIINYEADDVGFPMFLVQNRLLFLETTMKGRLKKIRKIFDLLTFKCTVEFK